MLRSWIRVEVACRALALSAAAVAAMLCLNGHAAEAQVNVLTYHNDIARTGQNLNETILTPADVNSNQFGLIFRQTVSGGIFGQPLYVSQVAIPNLGTHNVVYVTTTQDMVYAFDADNNGGTNALPLWKTSLLSGTLQVNQGVIGTPVIDPSTSTLCVVSSDLQGGNYIARLHALDITTGKEKFGAPFLIQASVTGTGSGSINGVLTFDAEYETNRAGLLFLNGVLYVSFGSVSDQGPWHGWIYSYALNSSTNALQQLNVFCTTTNGSGGGIWMGGAGLAAEVYSAAKPYGRMYVATGNGSFAVSSPYSKTMSYSMSLLNLDLTGGIMTVEDEFTPYDEATLNASDGDFGSGGPLLLPTQTLASGLTLKPLVQVGKSGTIFILDRDNNADGSNNPTKEYSPAGLGGFNASANKVVQQVQTPEAGKQGWGAGIWGMGAYWNNNIYFGGTGPGTSNGVTAYSFVNGLLSTTPESKTAEQFSYPAPTPSISANGGSSSILWLLSSDTSSNAVLYAYDATNLANLLYVASANSARDVSGAATKFAVPTVANGKVYVPTWEGLNFFAPLSTPAAAIPTINPSSGSFTGSQSVSITDSTPGAQIYYTLNGSTPSVKSTHYTSPFTITTSETVTAIANASGYVQSPSATATFVSRSGAPTPVFSLKGGTYTQAQTLSITDSASNATIYYTFDGSTPTTSSNVYTGSLNISASQTISAIAVAPGQTTSLIATATYTINPYVFNFSQGFADAEGPIVFNGSTDLDDFRLQLTNGGINQNGSAFYATKVNVQAFTTDFTFQLSNPVADGITFTIENSSPQALGMPGSGLGYQNIPHSVAIKFDIFNNAGEGPDSTGIYLDGAIPTVPSINLTGTGIDLHSGDYMDVHITYDGTDLNMTITDEVTLASWSHAFPVNIPSIVNGNTAYVGFTGSTGGVSASQKLTYWTWIAGTPGAPSYPAQFDGTGMALNGGSAISSGVLQLTSGSVMQNTSAWYSQPVDIRAFSTDFDFKLADGATPSPAQGFTFTIQTSNLNALGGAGRNLGYSSIPRSVAIKFDTYNNVGEGSDSTGVFTDGVTPTIPAINLTGTKLILSSGDTIHANVYYNGSTLGWTLTDLQTLASATNSVTINIPATVQSNTAYVGFTASTAGPTAVQSILNWFFTVE